MNYDPEKLNIWRTAHRVPDHVRHWQWDIVGDQAIEQAAESLIRGETVRFARISHDGATWSLLNVVKFARETANARPGWLGGKDRIRVHDQDGDPLLGADSHALGCWEPDSVVAVALAIAHYLRLGGVGFARLQPDAEPLARAA